MNKVKPVCSTLPMDMKLNSNQCPKSEKDKAVLKKVFCASAVGSLMHAMVCIRPDIAFVVRMFSRFISSPKKEHWVAAWFLKYLRGTSSVCLRFGLGKPLLEGFTDSDMSADVDTSPSTSGGGRIVAVEVAKVRGTINHGSEVHGSCGSRQRRNLDEGIHRRARNPTG